MDERFAALDPDMRAIVEALASRPSYFTMTAAAAREVRRTARAAIVRPLEEIEGSDNHALALNGRTIDIRVYRPLPDQTLLPGLIWYHGGGFVFGDLDDADATCRQLANRLRGVVVSVKYRLAPEHRFPAALDDAYDAWRAVTRRAKAFGIDESVVAVGGDSAGGNLATAVCQRAVDRGASLPIAQLLVYPVTRLTMNKEYFDPDIECPPLTIDSMVWFATQYLNSQEEADKSEVSPLLGNRLSELPPAVVVTAEYDVLRHQIDEYSSRLIREGVPVTALHYDGVVHGFFGQAPLVAKATLAINDSADAIIPLLAKGR